MSGQPVSDIYCTSHIMCTLGWGHSCFENDGKTCCVPYIHWISVTSYFPCLCRFVLVLTVLHLAVALEPHRWYWLGSSHCMPWDVLLHVCARAQIVRFASGCSPFLFYRSMGCLLRRSYEFPWRLIHSWPRWLLLALVNCCCRVLDVCSKGRTEGFLYVDWWISMFVFNNLLGYLNLIGVVLERSGLSHDAS